MSQVCRRRHLGHGRRRRPGPAHRGRGRRAGPARQLTSPSGSPLIIGVVALGAFAIGLAALEGSTRSAWPVIGAVLAVVTIGAPLLAAWRLGRIRAHPSALFDDVRTLLTRNAEAERIVIDTVEVEQGQRGTASPAVIGHTTQFSRLRQSRCPPPTCAAPDGHEGRDDVPGPARACPSCSSPVFAILGFLFLIAWIF